MKVMIPSALHSYTRQTWVEARGTTLAEVLIDLDRQYPGIRFRMIDEQNNVRRHIRIFINGEQTTAPARPLVESDKVVIVQALSGG